MGRCTCRELRGGVGVWAFIHFRSYMHTVRVLAHCLCRSTSFMVP